VNQFADHAPVGESLQVGAGLTEPAPDAFDVADPETLSDKGVQVDAAGDDVASSFGILESVAVGQGEFVECFGLDQGQVVADAAPAAGVMVPLRLAYRSPSSRGQGSPLQSLFVAWAPRRGRQIAMASTRPRCAGLVESALHAGSKGATTYPSPTSPEYWPC
jgi:hypothetical protein